MRDSPAIRLFLRNWFLREAELPDITQAETRLIEAAMGLDPGRWDGQPDLARMTAILAEHPDVLDRIGAHLLTVIVGMRGCGGAVSFLLDRGVPFNVDTRSYNVLHEAAWGGFPQVARLLIDYGVGKHHERPLKGNGERGVTSLQLAAECGRAETVKLLAAAGADLDTQDRKGRTPLHRATYEGHAEAAEALLAAGADGTVLNKNGKTAFEIARKGASYLKKRT